MSRYTFAAILSRQPPTTLRGCFLQLSQFDMKQRHAVFYGMAPSRQKNAGMKPAFCRLPAALTTGEIAIQIFKNLLLVHLGTHFHHRIREATNDLIDRIEIQMVQNSNPDLRRFRQCVPDCETRFARQPLTSSFSLPVNASGRSNTTRLVMLEVTLQPIASMALRRPFSKNA